MSPVLHLTRALLEPRKLFGDDDESSDKHTCPAEDKTGPEIVPFVGDKTFHDFASILAGACAATSAVIILGVILRHALNYSNPVQQRQVIRIVLLVPWVAFFSFLIVWQPQAGEYLLESLDFGCSIAISAFLLLLCDYILSNPGGFDELFGAGALKRGQFATSSSPPWLRRTWYMVLQYIPISIFIWIVTCITVATGSYCATSNNPHFAHIWLTVIKTISTVLAVLACLRFYKMKKTQLSPHKVMLKFIAFKGLIGLNIIQTLIINILVGNETIGPSKYLTYDDIKVGLPALLLACEMPLFAILLFFAFPVSVYKDGSPAAGPLTALTQALNITDLLSSFVRGPMRLVREQQWGVQRQGSFPLQSDPSNPPVYHAADFPVERPLRA